MLPRIKPTAIFLITGSLKSDLSVGKPLNA